MKRIYDELDAISKDGITPNTGLAKCEKKLLEELLNAEAADAKTLEGLLETMKKSDLIEDFKILLNSPICRHVLLNVSEDRIEEGSKST